MTSDVKATDFNQNEEVESNVDSVETRDVIQDTVQNKVALTLVIQKVTSETSILTKEVEEVGGSIACAAIHEDSLQSTISLT